MSAGSVVAPSQEQGRVRRTLVVVSLGRPTTPGFLRTAAVLLVTGLAVSGALAVLQLSARNDAARDVEHESAPMLADAEGLYRDLADADATASRAFLTGSTESAAVRARYDRDLERASARLTSIADAVGHASATSPAVIRIGHALPVFAARIASARANDRLGFPVGAAYLRDASDLMRRWLLSRRRGRLRGRLRSSWRRLPFRNLAAADDRRRGRRRCCLRRSDRHPGIRVQAHQTGVQPRARACFGAARRRRRNLDPSYFGVSIRSRPHAAGGFGLGAICAASRILALAAQSASTLAVIDRQPDPAALEYAAAVGDESGGGALLAEVAPIIDRNGDAVPGPIESLPVLRNCASRWRRSRTSSSIGRFPRPRPWSSATKPSTPNCSISGWKPRSPTRKGASATPLATRRGNGFVVVAVAMSIATLLAVVAVALGLKPRIAEYR